MKILTVRPPWSWLLFHGKDIENREWPCNYRGLLGIHAAKGMTKNEWWDCVEFVRAFDPKLADQIPEAKDLVRGAIIGTVMMGGFVTKSESPWFQGQYGFVMAQARMFDVPIPAVGKLGLWNWEPPV